MNTEDGRCGLEVTGSYRILLVKAFEWRLFLVRIDRLIFFFKYQTHMRKQTVTGVHYFYFYCRSWR